MSISENLYDFLSALMWDAESDYQKTSRGQARNEKLLKSCLTLVPENKKTELESKIDDIINNETDYHDFLYTRGFIDAVKISKDLKEMELVCNAEQ